VGKQRVEAFSDGVFAIAITLLVLTIAQPASDSTDVGRDLLRVWPGYAGYAVSFATIGIMWVNHHALFARLVRVDRVVLFLNLLLLMGVCFLPYPTGVLARYLAAGHDQVPAAVMYSAAFLVCAIGFNSIWAWAVLRRRLVGADFPEEQIVPSLVRFSIGGVVYAVCIAVAFVSPALSVVLVAAVAVYYVLDQLTSPQPAAGEE
jgi:uncharacterized membrane protein